MHHHLLSSSSTTTTTTIMPSSSSSSSSILKPINPNTPSPPSSSASSSSSSSYCKHSSPSATTLDLLILLLVLFSGSFLLTSYLSYLLTSLSLLLPHLSYTNLTNYIKTNINININLNPTHLYYVVFSISFVGILGFCEVWCVPRSRKCGKVKCRGLRKCVEFDLQIVKEGVLRGGRKGEWSVEEIEELPWKGGTEGNPDYECLRVELRKIAPANGKAVLLFRGKCGCPVAKLEGWGPKRGRRIKK